MKGKLKILTSVVEKSKLGASQVLPCNNKYIQSFFVSCVFAFNSICDFVHWPKLSCKRRCKLFSKLSSSQFYFFVRFVMRKNDIFCLLSSSVSSQYQAVDSCIQYFYSLIVSLVGWPVGRFVDVYCCWCCLSLLFLFSCQPSFSLLNFCDVIFSFVQNGKKIIQIYEKMLPNSCTCCRYTLSSLVTHFCYYFLLALSATDCSLPKGCYHPSSMRF